MKPHVFERQQVLSISIQQAWDFFSDPRNLSRITPPSMDFRIISQVPNKVYDGLKIEYRVRPLLGIPMKWVSVIQGIKEPFEFVDIQIKGPYKYWHHRHRFTEVPEGVLMEDIIHYEIPFEKYLPWLNKLIVSKQLEAIFDFRRQTLEKFLIQ